MAKFKDCHFYALVGLSLPTHDEHLDVPVCWILEPNEKECVTQDAYRKGTFEELDQAAEDFFGEEPIFFRHEDWSLDKKYYGC